MSGNNAYNTLREVDSVGTHNMDFNRPVQPAIAKKKRWNRKTKIWTAAAVTAIIIAVAVAVPVVLTRRSDDQLPTNAVDRYNVMFNPQGYRGTNLTGLVSANRQKVIYDRLLVFGSSYSDNGHDRAPEYAGSSPPTSSGLYYNKRWSNGPVWVEYLNDLLGANITQLNYAYGGATTNNSIHMASVPDTAQQMQWYLQHDYQANLKPIVATFTTTNDITATYRDYTNPSSSLYQQKDAALSVIRQAAQSFINQLGTLIPNDTSAVAPDYLILPILPVEVTPTGKNLARDAKSDTKFLAEISFAYNKVLMEGARSIAGRLGSRGNVFTYDVPAWFYSMLKHPKWYKVTDTDKGCLDVGCVDSSGFLWFDTLHIVSHLQRKLAQLGYNAITGVMIIPD